MGWIVGGLLGALATVLAAFFAAILSNTLPGSRPLRFGENRGEPFPPARLAGEILSGVKSIGDWLRSVVCWLGRRVRRAGLIRPRCELCGDRPAVHRIPDPRPEHLGMGRLIDACLKCDPNVELVESDSIREE